MKTTCCVIGLFFLFISCAKKEDENFQAPLFDNMGKLHYQVTTKSKNAQRFFDQGLSLAYAFNHQEAARSFKEAARLDSTCAMAYWGWALVLGPNINAPMDPANIDTVNNIVVNALKFKDKCTEKEQALIDAIAKRYPPDATADRAQLDLQYSAAMKEVWAKYPDDDNVGALYGESIMDCHPWDYWKKNGEPQEWTPEIIEVFEKVLQLNPDHPGANHYYIHAVEASANPDRAIPSADKLPSLIPGGGHIVHMPAHIYMRVGRYHDAVVANENASLVDSLYISHCKIQGFYPLAYYPHNIHFLSAAYSMVGNKAGAIKSGKGTSMHTDHSMMGIPALGAALQHYTTIPDMTMVRFGMWDEILKEPEPELIYLKCIWHYSRGMAYTGKNNLVEAENELRILNELSEDTILKTLPIFYNTVDKIVMISKQVLEGEILEKSGKHDEAIKSLSLGVMLEDSLIYNEPSDWFYPVRHHLGAVLMENKKYAEAEIVYRRDLELNRDNGWALMGLYLALKIQNKNAEAEAVKKKFDAAWQWADIKINSSRII
ncbi:MAG: hypothetical protein ACHQFW_04410 [Chitinophagales bacterium]